MLLLHSQGGSGHDAECLGVHGLYFERRVEHAEDRGREDEGGHAEFHSVRGGEAE